MDSDPLTPALASTIFRTRPKRISAFEVQLYRACDQVTEVLIYLMLVFSPWAFGTTQNWSIWAMNAGCYILGLALMIKLGLRWIRNYSPPGWDSGTHRERPARLTPRNWAVWILAGASILLLLFCLISALNARATFDDRTLAFHYRECINWLPHSLDATLSWFAFWMYLGLWCFFWSVRDWLLGKSGAEQRAGWQRSGPSAAAGSMSASSGLAVPARLRRLLWALAVSGGLLAVEAIVQRGVNSPKLLFLVTPRVHQTAEGQFGPYAYRSNAAQYFNLLWPVIIGFWWTLNRNRNSASRKGRNYVLLASAAVIAAAPIISTSRAGAIVTVAMAVAAAGILGAMHLSDKSSRRGRDSAKPAGRALLLFFCGALVLGFALGWETLRPRMLELNEGLFDREKMYDEARPMAKDYPWFGTGPGTFETVSQIYPHKQVFWAQLHNDWLETRITFGWVGSALIALAFAGVLLRWFIPGGIHGGRRFVSLIWITLAGCLLHARFDFPFQIHSTLLLFLVWCAVLSCLTRRTKVR